MTGVHLFFRTLLRTILSSLGPRIRPYDVARARFRVLPTDLDVFRHMNNGVYLSILDLGRLDLLRRGGIWPIFRERGWYPVVVSETISFRKSLTLWQRFTVESRILGYDDRAVYVEQRVVRNGEVYSRAFIRGRFLKRTGGVVTIPELLEAVPSPPADLVVPEWLLTWGADSGLPPSRAEAPSVW
ncbi:acyl-CoA thioesterase [Planctomonas psychrotolerans]|uniref:acyl-CoA thioesterase n=1 Tax=Planctomonas psychrotolerans TaxID=2528712 RepID=UPI00123A7B33|nr:thioesterase family protein [Planctomonas psychrotolerans]